MVVGSSVLVTGNGGSAMSFVSSASASMHNTQTECGIGEPATTSALCILASAVDYTVFGFSAIMSSIGTSGSG
jgi:hypothetical protein